MLHDNKKANKKNLHEQHRNNANVKASEGNNVKIRHRNNFLVEAVAGGVQVICNGTVLPLMPYKDALNRLDSGHYDSLNYRQDNALTHGLRIAYALIEGAEADYWDCSDHDMMVIWRYMVAAAFTFEMIDLNGLTTVDHDGKPEVVTVYMNTQASISVHPFATRIGLATHLEPVMIEHFGADEWERQTARFYAHMTGRKGDLLSELGRDVFAKLYDSLIQTMEEDGLPAAPVIH